MNGSVCIATATPVFDPFRYGTELPHEAVLHPFGFRTRLVSNSRDVLRAAAEAWSGFPALFGDKSLEIRAVVCEDEQIPCPTGLNWRAQGHLLTIVSDRDNFAVCDLNTGFAFCTFAPAAARNYEFLRSYYLETIVQTMLWQTHLVRVHAACVARDGRGVLLCGASGAGKSCLAYACARRGWTLITDESVAVVRDTTARMALGKPHQMHFRRTAAPILPELNGRLAGPANADGKIEIHAAELPDIRIAFHCDVAAVVFLNRSADGPARLVPLSGEEAFHRLDRDLPLFEEPVHRQNQAALRHLAGAGAYELIYSDLGEAVRTLEPLIL